jgi:hypothetical protein
VDLRRPALLAAILLSAAAARAQPAPDDTDWTVETGVPSSTTTAEGSFSTPETIRLGEQMRQRALDQICKAVDVPLNLSQGVDGLLGVSGGVRRSMRTIPNLPGDRLALVDQQSLAVDLGHTFEVGQLGEATFGITVGSRLEGTSIIVRPLPTNQACKELKKLAKLTTFKSVLPLSASRLAKMEVGELWKLPALLRIGHSEGVAMPAGTPYAAASISLGTSQTGSAIMTVYKLSPEQLRFRFRVEHVRVHDQSGGVTATYPASLIFSSDGANILMKQLDRLVARELQHYLEGAFGVFRTSANGQQVMMEFIVDARDPAQLEALATALKGDLRQLVQLAGRMVKLKGTEEASSRDFEKLDRQNEGIFGRSGDPSLDVYHDAAKGFHIHLPFFIDHSHGRDSRDDRISRLSEAGGQYSLYKEDKTSGNGYFEIPLKGQLVKRSTLRSAQSFVYESKDGKVSEPQAVYIYQEGFLRDGADSVRSEALEASRLTSLAGARGGAPNPRLAAPIDGLLPEPPPPTYDGDGNARYNNPTYHNGSITFTLVMTEKAVASILAATPELLAKCYRNTLGAAERAIFDTALRTAKFAADGTLEYDRRDFRRAFNDGEQDDSSTMEQLARAVSGIVRDVADIRNQPTPQMRAQALSKVLAGKGESGLEYADILAVLVQVVDPADITADLAINVRKGIKGEKDAQAHLTLKKDRADNPLLRGAAAAKQRFAKPSDLVD